MKQMKCVFFVTFIFQLYVEISKFIDISSLIYVMCSCVSLCSNDQHCRKWLALHIVIHVSMHVMIVIVKQILLLSLY